MLLLSVFFTSSAETVRVGWYIVDGLHDQDPVSEQYGGYDYEYLRAIGQFTGWDYEFVPGTFAECMDRLATGQVDIVGGLSKTPEREKTYLYPVNTSGSAGPRLVTTTGNTQYAFEAFSDFNGMTVGYIASSSLKEALEQYGAAHSFSVNTVSFRSQREAEKALQQGQVNALVVSGTRYNRDLRILAQLPQQGIYFVVTPSKPWLRDRLDSAISIIKFFNDNYDSDLYNKYFTVPDMTTVAFTNEEKVYLKQRIASGQPVIVAFDPAWIPAEYKDPATGKLAGIMAGVFDKLKEKTGLEFVFVTADSYNDTMKFYGQEAEVFATVSYDFRWADIHRVLLTQPVFDVQIFLVSNDEASVQDKVALTRGYHLTREVERRLDKKTAGPDGKPLQFVYYDTMADCIEAVCNKKAGRTYINSYELNYYMDKLRLDQLNIQSVSGFTEKTSIGVSRQADPRLFSILSRALGSLSQNDMNNIIMTYTTARKQPGVMEYVNANPLEAMVIVFIGAVLLFGMLFFYYTSRRNARQRLALQRANNAKSDFLSRISHDIRTPMNAIMGMTELAQREQVTPAVAGYLRKIDASNHFLLDLINDILDMSTIESGHVVLHPENYDMARFTDFVHGTVGPLMDKKHIQFRYTLDPALTHLFVDRLRFNQIFMNLLSNAAKFTPDGGAVAFSLHGDTSDGVVVRLRAVVRDTGIGMSKAFLPNLFQPFTQENQQHVNTSEGSGLGLAIVHRLVQAMAVTIDVESEP